jgi:hypothetical protein
LSEQPYDSPQCAGEQPMQTALHIDNTNVPEQNLEIENNFSRYECIVLLISILVLTSFFIIAAWSGILLIIGKTEGGGPLGMLMNALHIQLLL